MKYLIGLFCLLFIGFLPAQSFSLKDTTNQYDYVIITIPDFVPACENFKIHKTQNRRFKVLVTDTAEIYKEFSGYSTPPDRIEQFLQFIGTKWKSPQPRYILFAGDITKVPAWRLPAVGDDSVMFGIAYKDQPYMEKFHDSIGTESPYSVGRVAARNTDELNNYFSKVIAYESDSTCHEWNNRITCIAGNSSANEPDVQIFEDICNTLCANYVPEYFYKKIISVSGTSVNHGNTNDILNEINTNKTSVLYFSGGVAPYIFSTDSIFTIKNVGDIKNEGSPFFMYILSCQNFSGNTIGSIMDSCILAKNAAVCGFAGVCPVYLTLSSNAFNSLFSSMYSGGQTIGDSWQDFLSHKHEEAYSSYAIFGDPSLKPKFLPLLAASESAAPVKQYALHQNYPNPFNPSTTIKYSVADNGLVSLSIYNQLGQRVAELYHGEKQSGTYSVTWNAIGFPSGVYFCELKTTHYREVKKLLLVK
jgi:hypothetical protein